MRLNIRFFMAMHGVNINDIGGEQMSKTSGLIRLGTIVIISLLFATILLACGEGSFNDDTGDNGDLGGGDDT